MPGSRTGTVRYNVPDLSVKAEDRGLFSGPAHSYGEDIEVSLLDPDSDQAILTGLDGIDAQGFAYVNAPSSLDLDEWLTGTNVEERYVVEVEALVKKVTGARQVCVNHLGIRKRLAANNADPTFYRKKGDKHDEAVKKMTGKNAPWVTGRQDAGLEPARFAHCDYTIRGLKRTARYCRRDIKNAAQEALDAEDDTSRERKRYAAYSIWRPIKTVKRDPLAVADWRTVDTSTLQAIEYRATSNVLDSGEYMLEQYTQTPDAKESMQKWYCKPNQQPDDVLFIKLSDSAAEHDPNIAAGCIHCSPMIDGVQDEEPRMSVEARVMVFW